MSESQIFASIANDPIQQYVQSEKKSTVYVEKSNNDSQLENILYANDQTLPLASLTYGSTNTVTASNGVGLLKEMILEVRLPEGFVAYSDYMAYSLIKDIKFSIGGGEFISWKKEDILLKAISLCRNKQQRDRLLEYAGRRKYTVATSGQTTNVAIVNPEADNAVVGPLFMSEEQHRTYYAILPMPWTNLGNNDNKLKPFPLHLIQSPNAIQMQITWESANEVASAGAGTGLEAASIHYKRGSLMTNDQAKSLLVPYKYPCILPIGSQYNIAAGASSVNINSFRKGEVQDMLFSFVPISSTGAVIGDTSVDAGVTGKRFFDGVKVQGLKLLFNSQVVWQADNKLAEVYKLIDDPDDCDNVHNPLKHRVVNSATQIPVQGLLDGDVLELEGEQLIPANNNRIHRKGRYFYNIPIAEIVSKLQAHGGYNGGDFSSQTLRLEFDPIKAATSKATTYNYINAACVLTQVNNYRVYYKFEKGTVSLNF